MLVVIAIIAILAAILFPVFARAREKARSASCQSNLKQIGLAYMMYAQDYDETFGHGWPDPSWSSYWNQLQPYLKNKQIALCPSQPGGTACACGYAGGVNDPAFIKSNYIRNPYTTIGFYANMNGRPLADFKVPAETILMGDGRRSWVHFAGWCRADGNDGQACDPSIADRHNGGANFSFIDGHVKFLKVPSAVAAGDAWLRMWNPDTGNW